MQLTYIEEYEGELCDLLIAGVGEWNEGIQEQLWKLADRCILSKNKRPTSSDVSPPNNTTIKGAI